MLRRMALLSVVAALLCGLLVPIVAHAQGSPPPPATSSLLVKMVAGLTAQEQAVVIARNGGVEVSTIPVLRLHVIQVLTSALATILASYQADPQVQSAEENKKRLSETMPGDPLYPNQWALPRIAWDQVYGTVTPLGSAKVALLDTGIDGTHPDLAGTIVPGLSILDGGNGMMDPSGHGTWLAGIIAAQTNNVPYEGIAGVAYSAVTVMPVTVLDANGEGQDSEVIAGVIWAADNGADVIVMAFSAPDFSGNLQDAIDYAWSKGAVLVAAVGNNALSEPTFPAGHRGVMGISATDSTDSLASFSNDGQAVFLAAPGVDIQTTDIGGAYTVVSGTSSSAAIVAGTAAFMKAVDPTLTNGVIVGRIARTADPAGTQVQTGNGRINMARVLADTGTDVIQPAGAAPVGAGGPFVGPYRAAAPGTFTLGPVTPNTSFSPTPGFIMGSSGNSFTLVMTVTFNGNNCSGSCPKPTTILISTPTSAPALAFQCPGSSGSGGGRTYTCTSAGSGQILFSAGVNDGLVLNSPATFTVSVATVPAAASDLTDTFRVVYTSGFSGTPSPAVAAPNTLKRYSLQITGITPPVASANGGDALNPVMTLVNRSSASQTLVAANSNLGGTAFSSTGAQGSMPTISSGASGTVTFTGAVIASGPGTKTVTGTAGNATATAPTFSKAITVNKGTPAFSGLAAPTITFGQTPTTLNGTLSAGSVFPSGSVNITLNGVTQGAAINSSNGAFSSSFNTSALAVSGSPYTITYSYPGNTDFNAVSDTSNTLTVQKAGQTITFNALVNKTFGDADVGVSATASSGLAVSFSSLTAGTCTVSGSTVHIVAAGSCTIRASQTGDGNYTAAPDVDQSFTLNKATPTVSVSGGTFTYDGTPHAASGFAYGVGGVGDVLSPAVTFSYAGTGATTYGPTATAPTGAGTYQATASFAGDANYTIASNTASITISKADPIVTATGNTCTYNGTACAGSGTATGVNGENLSPVTLAYSAAPGPGNLLTSAPVNAGIYYVAARYAGDANYNQKQSAPAPITINKATPTVSVGGGTFTYDGSPHAASGFAYGVGGVGDVLSPAVTFSYAGTGATTYGPTATAPTGAGAYQATASFAGNANYTSASNTASITIIKADPIVTATGNICTYNGTACTGSGTATGVNGEPLTPVTVAYTTTPAPGSLLTSAPVNAGAYLMAARYAGDTNYNQKQSAPAPVTINKATPTVSVTGGTFTYDGNPHAASGFAYGVGGVADVLSPAMAFTYLGTGSTVYGPVATAPTGAGTYQATASFAGDANYTTASNTASITISKADPIVTATGNTCTYNGTACAGSGTATGVNGANLSPVTLAYSAAPGPGDLLTSAPVNAGIYYVATRYAGDANYNQRQSASATITIDQADQIITFGALADKYFGDPDFTVSATASSGLAVTFTASSNCTVSGNTVHITGVGSCTITALQNGNANYAAGTDVPQAFSITDNTPPDTAITGGPAAASLSNNSNPSYSFTGSDDVTALASLTFECQLDGAGFLPCTSPAGYSGLGDGGHTFQVRAKDSAGNVGGTPASRTWTVDATAPDTAIDTRPLLASNSTTASFSFHATETPSTFTCQLDAQPAHACDSGSATYGGLGDGSHTFVVAATDQAGNTDPSPASFAWTVDSAAPNTVIDTAPTDPTTSTSATFTFHGSDVSGDTFECRLDGTTPAAFTPCSSPVTYTGLTQDTHTFEVRAQDAAGNLDPTPASYTWTIGAVQAEAFHVDEEFRNFDGFEIAFGKGVSGPHSKIKNTNPKTFHHLITIKNETGAAINAANSNTATTIVTVPGMPTGPNACGFVNCSSQMGGYADPAFGLREHRAYHLWPDDRTDDMPVSVHYMTLAQYQANGDSCAVGPSAAYSSTLAPDGAAKCIKITGYGIPKKHKARLRLNFEFRPKDTDGWDPTAKDRFFVGFAFHTTTTVTFGSTSQTATTSEGIVGAGNKMTAVGGFVFNGPGTPQAGLKVRVFNTVTQASCTDDTNLVAQDVTDANGFYFIYRTGTAQNTWAAPNLPDGVKYTVQLCSGAGQLSLQTTASKLKNKEFEELDFEIP